ncbi:MAG: GHKL domain-containing protein [Lachnospiraceae bacterium]
MTSVGFINLIICLLTYFVANYIMVSAFESKKRYSSFREAVTIWLLTLPLSCIKLCWNHIKLVQYGFLITIIIVSIIYLHIRMQGSIWQKILFVMLQETAFFIGEVTASFILKDAISKLESWDFNTPTILIADTMVNLIGLCVYWMFLWGWKRIVWKRNYNAKTFLVFLFFPMSQVFLICANDILALNTMTPGNISLMVGTAIGFVADILLMITLLRQQQMHEMELKLSQVEKAWDTEKKHYEEIEIRREELAKIRHDMTEQFILMSELIQRDDKEKVKEMLKKLTEYVAATREYVYCADNVVNAIMSENEKICKEKGIRLEYEFAIHRPLEMNAVVICSIFSNLFRNAIAAAEQAQGEKKISLKASLMGDYLHIKEENTYNKSARRDDRKGYGLEILRNMTERHNGQMDVKENETWFMVEMSLENKDIEK